jgi:hypothetical protein
MVQCEVHRYSTALGNIPAVIRFGASNADSTGHAWGSFLPKRLDHTLEMTTTT